MMRLSRIRSLAAIRADPLLANSTRATARSAGVGPTVHPASIDTKMHRRKRSARSASANTALAAPRSVHRRQAFRARAPSHLPRPSPRLRQVRRRRVRGIAADDDAAAKPRPWHQDRLNRAVDDIGIRAEGSRNLGDVATVLRQARLEQIRIVLAPESGIGCFRADMEDVHEIVAQRHGAGLAPDTLQKFHAPYVIGPRHLHAPGAVTGRARQECATEEMLPGGRPYAVEAGEQIEAICRPSEKRTVIRFFSSWISLTVELMRISTPARSAAASRISCNRRRDSAQNAGTDRRQAGIYVRR